ncbi:MAG: MYXO-CTERM sorting domain-containing protein [Myxococcales bacterium]
MLLVRRQAQQTAFVASYEPSGDQPKVTKLEALATDVVAADEAFAVGASGSGFADAVLAVADGAGGTRRTFGSFACDGVLCLVRSGPGGELARLVLAQGKSIEGAGGALLEAAKSNAGVDVAVTGTAIAIGTSAGLDGELRIRAGGIQKVTLDGASVGFTQDGAMVVIQGVPPSPDAGSPDSGGPSAVDSGAEAGDAETMARADAATVVADAAVQGADAAASSADSGGAGPATSGCGCSSAGAAPLGMFGLAALLRRRRCM